MTQFCIEEALIAALLAEENKELAAQSGESETTQRHREIMEQYKQKAGVGR